MLLQPSGIMFPLPTEVYHRISKETVKRIYSDRLKTRKTEWWRWQIESESILVPPCVFELALGAGTTYRFVFSGFLNFRVLTWTEYNLLLALRQVADRYGGALT